MKLVCASISCLLLLCLAIPETQSRVLQPSIDIRNPDIDPSWYTGRGIRPVGRFGRRGTTWEDTQNSVYRPLGQTCVPIEDSAELNGDI
ncbi:prolactin-releasing peptide [Dendropsophus ebraccatus]|uniref:prolactin-releasing peptide n=1 Tax=Dendropsophus ebraccatus TaxID=150705 RepID=UPI003831F100